MFKKIKNTIFLIFFLSFILLVTKHYFSEENIAYTNKSRLTYLMDPEIIKNNLPLLKNDTSDIIIYMDEIENFNNKRKKRFWEQLIFRKNE